MQACINKSICLTINVPNSNMSNICFQRNFSGEGLRSVVVLDLYPDEDYSVKVRCGAQQNFWRWGDWSKPFSFKTNIDGKQFPWIWAAIFTTD